MAKKIVLIMTDTQRWDMVNCYKNTGLQTPNIDRLAAGGLRFERAYTCQPVCGPARSAIFSGQFPHSNGVHTNSVPFYDNVKTLGQRLSDNGFKTAYIGKWHLDGGDYFGTGRCPDGWDDEYWYDMRRFLEEHTDEDRLLSRDESNMDRMEFPREFTFGNRVSKRAINFLEKYGGENFFLSVSYDEPHGPCICPEPYASMYKDFEFPKSDNVYDDLDTKPEHQRAWAGASRFEDKRGLRVKDKYYFGCNTFIDSEIGSVVDAVDKYAPDALVIYSSDHGCFLHSHSLSAKGPAAYDEITRIPLIIREPGKIAPGSVYEHPVSHIDLAPTIMEHAGLPIPKLLEGKDLSPVYSNASKKINERIFIEFGRYEIDHDSFGGYQPMRAAFDGRYKLALNLLWTDEFYDLANDPGETDNLIESKDGGIKKARDALHDKILDWMNDTRDPFRGYCWERRPWREDARPATWKYTSMTRQREHEEYEPRQMDYDTGLPMETAVRRK